MLVPFLAIAPIFAIIMMGNGLRRGGIPSFEFWNLNWRDPGIIAPIADGRRWMDDLIEGQAASVAEITEREELRPDNGSRTLPLAWLAPDIAAEVLEGGQPNDLTANTLHALPDFPRDWTEQRRILGFPAA